MDKKKLKDANKKFEKQKKSSKKSTEKDAEKEGMSSEKFRKNIGCGG